MKKILFIAALMIMSISTVSVIEKADTLKADNTKVEKVIEDTTTNTKGKPVVNYYILYNRELIKTSETVAKKKITLCKKYNAKCALAIVVKGSSKRIILD